MTGEELFWAKFGAISQAVGSAATFLAVAVSLWIAGMNRRPAVRLVVGERLIIGLHGELRLLMFDVANRGEIPLHVRTIGWETGWIARGPSWLRSKAAVQLTGQTGFGVDLPFDVQPGSSVSAYANMANVLRYARDRVTDPLFTRDWPVIGRRQTRVRAYAYTATGHSIVVKPERALLAALIAAEKAATGRKSPQEPTGRGRGRRSQ